MKESVLGLNVLKIKTYIKDKNEDIEINNNQDHIKV